MRKLGWLLILITAMWLAGRAARRHAQVPAQLWLLAAGLAAGYAPGSPRVRALEARMDYAITQLPVQQPAPGAAGFGGAGAPGAPSTYNPGWGASVSQAIGMLSSGLSSAAAANSLLISRLTDTGVLTKP